MPDACDTWLPHGDILSFEEMSLLADLFGELGATRVRLTGGEPLLRRDLPTFVSMLAARAWLQDLALTTNGVRLAEVAGPLFEAGLHRLTVSLDTLDREKFQRLARMDGLPRVLAGLDAARAAGFTGLKIDSVITRGDNDDELVALLEYARGLGAEIRFIEYMAVGSATRWRPEAVVSARQMLDRLEAWYGPIARVDEASSAPARRFRLADGYTFGIIASTTEPFCRTCDRARLTADGVLLLCLHAEVGTNLRRALRDGASSDALRGIIRAAWTARADRGAEARHAARERDGWAAAVVRERNVHLEMHTRGG
jgi:cyclic pyranopterin phosphate synthase